MRVPSPYDIHAHSALVQLLWITGQDHSGIASLVHAATGSAYSALLKSHYSVLSKISAFTHAFLALIH